MKSVGMERGGPAGKSMSVVAVGIFIRRSIYIEPETGSTLIRCLCCFSFFGPLRSFSLCSEKGPSFSILLSVEAQFCGKKRGSSMYYSVGCNRYKLSI